MYERKKINQKGYTEQILTGIGCVPGKVQNYLNLFFEFGVSHVNKLSHYQDEKTD